MARAHTTVDQYLLNLDRGGLLMFHPGDDSIRLDTQIPFVVEATAPDPSQHYESNLFKLRYPIPNNIQYIDRKQMWFTSLYYHGTIIQLT